MKGEAFLLAAVIISVALVAMFQPMRSEYLVKQKQLLQKEFFLDIFENIFNEIKNSIYLSYDNFDSMILNSYDFLKFSQKIANQKAMNFKSLIIVAQANETGYLNLTVINFLSENLLINLTFNNIQNTTLFLGQYSINSTNFTYSPGNSYNLTIQYENIERSIEIETFANKKIFLAYVDVSLSWLGGRSRKINYFFMS
jgi:hypothetical protein